MANVSPSQNDLDDERSSRGPGPYSSTIRYSGSGRPERLRGLLERRLVVVEGEVREVDPGDVRRERPLDERPGGRTGRRRGRSPRRSPRSRPRAARASPRRPIAPRPPPSAGYRPSPSSRAFVDERRGRDQVRLDLRERAFLQVREGAVDQLADDEPEDRVAEELEPLVVRRAGLPVLVREGLVRQRAHEQLAVAKGVPELLLEVARPRRSPIAALMTAVRLVVPEAGVEPARAFRPSGF